MNEAYLFNTGKNYQAYKYLGAHPYKLGDQEGYIFRVWAPQAQSIALCGSFNNWDENQHFMEKDPATGIWQAFRADVKAWDRYQYLVKGKDGSLVYKADPFAVHQETRPAKASIIYEAPDFAWTDAEFMKSRPLAREPQPLNIYEVHCGSWRTYPDGNFYNYRDLGRELAAYCQDMAYNAVELLPIMEHPLDASWGYQVTGYFAPTSRFGTPDDFKAMVNTLHEAGIRVILDWVPAHYPKDAFGLYHFDGSPCYEYADPRLGEQQAWGTMVFDYSKAEVQSFLLSSAYYWLAEYHLDGLRVDAVSSMIYLDYGRTEYVKNRFGGNDNLEALYFLRTCNEVLAKNFPQALLIAEESTAYPHITKPVEEGGLGFTHKWNMGWMHDTLNYMSVDYYARKYHHNKMSFSMTYAFSEHYILPYSHDEVVHGKKSIIGRMPGDIWRQCASLKTCYAWQFTHPGGKLNFMGNDFGQFVEWREYEELQWFMLEHNHHRQIQDFNRALHRLYLSHPALYMDDQSWHGFRWVQVDDRENSVFAVSRIYKDQEILVVLNMTPAVLDGYELEVENCGTYTLLLNSDDSQWGGSAYLGPETEGMVYQTSPLGSKDLDRRQQDELVLLKDLHKKAAQQRTTFLKQRRKLYKSYSQLLGTENPDQDLVAGLVGDVAPLPQVDVQKAKPKLILDLPPLSAMFLEFKRSQE